MWKCIATAVFSVCLVQVSVDAFTPTYGCGHDDPDIRRLIEKVSDFLLLFMSLLEIPYDLTAVLFLSRVLLLNKPI